jgi:hypothetical protein
MKFLKKYESFEENDELLLDIKDILIELEDLDFNIEYSKSVIFIHKNNDFFYMDENVKYTLKRLANYLNKDLYGYWSSGAGINRLAMKFYIYRDNRDIRTNTSRGNSKMDEKWPRIFSLSVVLN